LRKTLVLTPVSAHPAFLAGRCSECHDPHVSANETLLRKPPVALCPSCHAGLVRAPDGEAWGFPHKPVAEGKCRLCHRSHTAANADLLKAPSPKACRPCHVEFFTKFEGARSRHAPVAAGSCGSCHQLHGSAVAALLREGVRGAICRGCHPKLLNAHHQLTQAELESKEGGEAAAERGCTYCHQPHDSSEPRLLHSQENRACRGCHRM
jgi:predicted CXXCH cytochrome family protein